VPGIDREDLDVLQPRRLYEAQGRLDEYKALVERFHRERTEFLQDFPSLSDEIVAAVG
jgi:phosphoenolpyruvate carboxykinase (ATP)